MGMTPQQITKQCEKVLGQLTKRLTTAYKDKLDINDQSPSSLGSGMYKIARAASNQNFEEGCIFKQAVGLFIVQLEEQMLSHSKILNAFEHFFELAEIIAAQEQLEEKIILSYEQYTNGMSFQEILDTSDFKIIFSPETLESNIKQWVEDEYSAVDERHLSNEERQIRRMDSLARLLTLRPGLSACSAVTLDNASFPHCLLIAANVGKQGDQEEIITALANRINILQEFLTAIDIEKLEFSTQLIEALSNELVDKILPHGSSSLPAEILRKSAKKIIDAVIFDNETFTEVEKAVFFTNGPAYLLTPQIKDESASMLLSAITNSTSNRRFALPQVPPIARIKDIHCEQLITHYLFAELRVQPNRPLNIGVTKLCCRTCFENLNQQPVNIRGHHGQTYKNVVDLSTGECSTTASQRRATTHPEISPADTPEQREAKKRARANRAALMGENSRKKLPLEELCSSSQVAGYQASFFHHSHGIPLPISPNKDHVISNQVTDTFS